MLLVTLPVVDRINSQNNKFATGVENNVTGDSKLNDKQKYRKSLYKLESHIVHTFCVVLTYDQ